MARFTGGSSVPGGYYWNPRHGTMTPVTDPGGTLPGKPTDRYVRVHWLVALLAAPLLGGLFVVLLPFIGLAMMVRYAFERITGQARAGARDLAATVTPGWRPGEVHLTGRSVDGTPEELHGGGAGESALKDVADEIAHKRSGGKKD